jgi:hypothetical protein
MRIRDLFADQHIQIAIRDGAWEVAIGDDHGQRTVLGAYVELPEAMDIAHEALLMLADETEIVPDELMLEEARAELRERLARHAAGEPWEPNDLLGEETGGDERLRHWFEREMES